MNNILIDSDISYWGFSARWLSSKLSEMTGELQVDISSYGGDVFEGIDMFNQLRRYSKEKGHVTTVGGSKVMSIASLLLLAGDTRKAHSNSTIMIHKSWTWLAGNSDDLIAESKVLNGIDIILAKQYAKHMDGTQEEIMKVMSEEGWFVGQEQIEGTNFINEFIQQDDEVEISAKSNYKKAMARFSAKAQEDNVKPNLDEVKASIVECNDGKCPMDNSGVNHSSVKASAQIKKTEEGISMKYTEETYKALEASNAEALKVESDKLATATKSLSAMTTEKETAITAFATLTESVKAKADMTVEIVAMAHEKNVSQGTLVAMIQAPTLEAVKVAVVDGMDSDGAFGANNGDGHSASEPWGQILSKKKES